MSDGQRIYVHVSMLGLWCFDINGSSVWHKDVPKHVMQYGWGPGASPILHADSLIIQCDNEKSSFLAAFDKSNGKLQWRVEREEASNWSTPWLWNHNERIELVACGGKKTISYDPKTGQTIWELAAGGRSATTAVGNKDVVVVASVTKSQGQSRALTCVRAGATGTLDRESPHVVWQLAKESPELSSPILLGDYLFTVRQQGGIVNCFDVSTGERYYRRRLPRAGGFTASPWSTAGKLFCLDENGSTFVIEPAPDFKLVATNQLDGQFRSSPAIAGGRLILRSVDHLFCVAAERSLQ